MKSRRIIFLIIVLLLVVGIVVASVLYFFPFAKKTKENIFRCNNVDEVEIFVTENNIVYEKHDNSLHLFNIKYGPYSGYCVVEFESDSGKIFRMDFYMTFDNSETLSNNIEDVKNVFLNDFGFKGKYEYFSINEDNDDVGEQDFLEQKASKELFVYEDNTTWNVSWYIAGEKASAKISKSVFS